MTPKIMPRPLSCQNSRRTTGSQDGGPAISPGFVPHTLSSPANDVGGSLSMRTSADWFIDSRK